MSDTKKIIEDAFENRGELSPDKCDKEIRDAVYDALEMLNSGEGRVAEKVGAEWQVNEWLKKAVLLSFRIEDNSVMPGAYTQYWDKVPSKFDDYTEEKFREGGFRIVPPAAVRRGSYVAKDVVVMPSFINIGAYVDEGTMVDTWATVGSCAQVGKNVHLSGGVGIGGVLEPASANPVIIEDGCFIGSRCILVEGVRIGAEAVLAANVTITASTPIIDTREGRLSESKGFIPPRSVVVPGTKEKEVGGGKIYTSCAYIIGERKASTDLKTSLNDVLREFALSV